MKKVLFINTTFGTGGAPKVAKDLFEYLGNVPEYKVYFAYGRGPEVSIDNVIKIGNLFEKFLHIFLVRVVGIEGFGSYFSTLKLIRFIKKEKIDIVHLHNIHGYYLNFYHLFSFLKKSGIKVLWTFHDEWPITSLKAHSMGCEHCKTGVGKCTSTYPYPKTYNNLFLRRMLNKKKKAFLGLKNVTIISPAIWLTDNIKKSFLGGYQILTIVNGVDNKIFYPRKNKQELREKYNISGGDKVIVFNANNLNDTHKGVGYVLELAEKMKDEKVLFIGFGGGIDGVVNKNIKLMGKINNVNKISEILGLADIFIFPSLVETASLAVLEAMACGLPVVGFKIPALREMVSASTGILCDIGNREEVKNSIVSLIRDDSKREKMGCEASEFIKKNNSSSRFLENYKELFDSL